MIRDRFASWMLWVIILAVSAVGGAQAQQSPPAATSSPSPTTLGSEVLAPIEKLAKTIAGAEDKIEHLKKVEKEVEEDLSRLRSEVEDMLAEAYSAAEDLRPKLAEIKGLIEQLGRHPRQASRRNCLPWLPSASASTICSPRSTLP